ncbi:MAG: hypothetical protein ACREDR_44745 [Blastocatellia bacterium]
MALISADLRREVVSGLLRLRRLSLSRRIPCTNPVTDLPVTAAGARATAYSAPIWTFSVSAFNVIQDHPVHIR